MNYSERRLLCLAAGTLMAGCSAATSEESEAGDAFGQIAQGIQRDMISFQENDLFTRVNLLTATSNGVNQAIVVKSDYADPNALYGVCGATFISKHYALTASHCVKNYPYTPALTFPAKRILTTGLNLQAAEDASKVSGGPFPWWTIADKMVAGDNYSVTTHWCGVKWRCDASHGPRDCPAGISGDLDVALIHCPNRPTPKDWLPVHSGDPTTGYVEMHWFHEVLDLQVSSTDSSNNVPAGNWTNYGQMDSPNYSANYHYTNGYYQQYLPLRSQHWEAAWNMQYRIVQHFTAASTTDVRVCHGASGSGVFLSGNSAVLGPQFTSDLSLLDEDRLCHNLFSGTPGTFYSEHINPPKSRVLEDTVKNTDR